MQLDTLHEPQLSQLARTSSAAFLFTCCKKEAQGASELMAGLMRVQPPSLQLGVRVVRVDGLDQERLERGGGGTLFLRYYVPAGDGRQRLRVDTREVPCGAGDLRWGELARFERWGGGGAAGPTLAAAGGIAFELRWRPRPSSSSGLAALVLGAGARVRPSRVLARAELPWADVSSSQPTAERWLTLSRVGRELGGCKAPKLLVEVKAVHAAVATERRTPGGMTECCRAGERCGQCGWIGSEEDMFLAATFSQQH